MVCGGVGMGNRRYLWIARWSGGGGGTDCGVSPAAVKADVVVGSGGW